jgi:hypothetical protein
MPEREFIRCCKERGIDVDPARLRQFERIGVFRPMLRVFPPKITFKIEMVDQAGAMRAHSSQVKKMGRRDARRDRRVRLSHACGAGLARGRTDLVAGARRLGARSDVPQRHEAYYSRFQILKLDRVVTMLTMTVQLEWATSVDGSPNDKWNPRLRYNAGTWGHRVAAALNNTTDEDVIAALIPLIANRFFYKTQSDGRQMTIGHFHDWDWAPMRARVNLISSGRLLQ